MKSPIPPPPAAGGAQTGGALAPGFRFHPTDEELIIYYLKRKILNRPLRFDAMAEVDLYKIEPWDVPELSRIQSRDLEWYFFSPLDRKYSNRSRTNRATLQGYWKTTGKDRAVNFGNRVVGMKKTLVFHVGRAPKGERTNWVMHEYRLEDEKLAESGVQQDGYVVCRIFQKRGAGPQNGAQYGAPFMEEEWDVEDEANGLCMVPVGLENEVIGAEDNEYLQSCEAVQSQETENQDQGAFNAQVAGSNVHAGSSVPAHCIGIIKEQPNDMTFLDEMFDYVVEPRAENNSPICIEEKENSSGIEIGPQSPPSRPDEFLELNDVLDIANVECSSEESGSNILGPSFTQGMADGEDTSSYNLFGNDKFLNGNENSEQFELLQALQLEDSIDPQPNGLPINYSCPNECEDDMSFYDAPTEFSFMQESLFQLNEQNPPVAGPSSLDTVDDFMAYFDATDDMLHYGNSSQFENMEYILDQFKIDTKVDDSSSKEEVSFANVDGASSSVLHKIHDVPSTKNTSRKRLVNMLGSIAAPSAFASEFPPRIGKVVKNISATSSPIHVTAGLIEIHSLAMTGIGENWSVKKNPKVDFVVSCSVADASVGKSVYAEPDAKFYGGSISVILRGSFNIFIFSALILAISCKVGMHIYSC